MILSSALFVMVIGIAAPQGKRDQKPTGAQFQHHIGSGYFQKILRQLSWGGCQRKRTRPMSVPPPKLTTLTKRHDGKYPEGYVAAVLKFGRSRASHGSEDMPVWGS